MFFPCPQTEIERTGGVVRLRQETAERLLGCPFDGDRHALAQACAGAIGRPVDPSRVEVIEAGDFAVFGPVIGFGAWGRTLGFKSRSIPFETYAVTGSDAGMDWQMQLCPAGVLGFVAGTIDAPSEPCNLTLGEKIVGPWMKDRRRYAILTGESPADLGRRLAGIFKVHHHAHVRVTGKVSL